MSGFEHSADPYSNTLTIPPGLADRILGLSHLREEATYKENFAFLEGKISERLADDWRPTYYQASINDEWFTLLVQTDAIEGHDDPISVIRLTFGSPERDILSDNWSMQVDDYFVDLADQKLGRVSSTIRGTFAGEDQPLQWFLHAGSGPCVVGREGAVTTLVGSQYDKNVRKLTQLTPNNRLVNELLVHLEQVPLSQRENISHLSTRLVENPPTM